MTRILAIDLETIPQAKYVEVAHEAVNPSPLLPYKPTEEWLESNAAATIGQIGSQLVNGEIPLAATGVPPALHPTTAHLAACNYGWLDSEGEICTDVRVLEDHGKDFTGDLEEAEAWLVAETFGRLASAIDKGTLIVTFNGKNFDLGMLRARAALLRIPNLPKLPWKRLLYPFDNKDCHCDLRYVVNSDDRRARGTLQHWADSFGIHAEERGKEVWSMVRDGNWNALREYGHCEGRTLVELFQLVEGIL